MSKIYDYLIVGAGSAGCVLANRLSANPSLSVLLIESGPADSSPLISMPRGIGKLLAPGNPHVWDYKAVPRAGAPQELWLKGRTLGGSSSVNGMVYARGAPSDYDHWAELGCTGWSWNELGRLFVALEDHQLGGADWRGSGGPLAVSVQPSGNPLAKAILDAAVEAGTPQVDDVNDVDNVTRGGLGYQPRTIDRRGRRSSASRAFLAPARGRANLDVLTGAQVLRVRFEGQRAVGVDLRDAAGLRNIDVAPGGEVILSAGAIESPKLLQLSGIGPGALLQSFGIPVLRDAPEVGANLREHRYLPMRYRVTGGSFNERFSGVGLLGSLAMYLFAGKGPLSHAAHELGGYVKTRPGLDRADVQIGIGLYSTGRGPKGVTVDPYPGLTLGGYVARPQSRGVTRIQSADPNVAPYLDANYLSEAADRESAIGLFRWLRRLAEQPSLKSWIVQETSPGAQIQSDDEALDAFIRFGGTPFHICGTARMGGDEASVLDPQLRVRGVSGLRVVDTSIMPTLVAGNTNAPAMVIGLRAAELLLAGRA